MARKLSTNVVRRGCRKPSEDKGERVSLSSLEPGDVYTTVADCRIRVVLTVEELTFDFMLFPPEPVLVYTSPRHNLDVPDMVLLRNAARL